MYRTLISKVALVAAGVALMSAFASFQATPAQAATITITDNSCSSFSTSGSGSNLVINCGGQSCSISSSAGTTIPIGTPTTLTGSCTGAVGTWAWSGGGTGTCPSISNSGTNTQSVPAASQAASNCAYTLNVSGGAGAATAQIALTWSSGGGGAPSGCSANANPNSLPVGGGATTVSVSCVGGGAPTSYSWSASPPVSGLQSTTSTNSQTVSVTQSTTFFVTPSNASGAGNQASAGVTVQTGGGGGFANCTNQGFTVIPAGSVPLTWGTSVEPTSSSAGNFGDGNTTVWLFTLTVPAGAPGSDNGYLAVTEFGQGPTLRQATISKVPCDFRTKDYTGNAGPLGVSNGTTARVLFGVHAPSFFGTAGLTAGQTYYISVRNWQLDPVPQNSCAGTTCNAKATYQPAQ